MKVMESDQQLHTLLSDTVELLCKSGLTFKKGLRIQGTLGITVDGEEIVFLQIDKAVKPDVKRDITQNTVGNNVVKRAGIKASSTPNSRKKQKLSEDVGLVNHHPEADRASNQTEQSDEQHKEDHFENSYDESNYALLDSSLQVKSECETWEYEYAVATSPNTVELFQQSLGDARTMKLPDPPQLMMASPARKIIPIAPTAVQSSLRKLKDYEDRKFPCRYCSSSFKRAQHRKEHERTHTDERPFTCQLCQTTFRWRQSLKKHLLKSHSNEISLDTLGQMLNPNVPEAEQGLSELNPEAADLKTNASDPLLGQSMMEETDADSAADTESLQMNEQDMNNHMENHTGCK